MRFFSLALLSLFTTAITGAATPKQDTQIEKRATFSPFAGTNAYWLPFLSNDADIDATFKAIQAAGLKVVRTWGFHDSTSCQGIHFQCWSGSTPTINTGSNGLQRLDAVVNAAQRYGIKLVIPFVNNWGDYGGMDVYVSKLGLSGHAAWYTDSRAQTYYRNYIAAVVNRYKSSSAIFSWQLANEPRCPGCATSVITNWATSISAYIKSLDSSHYVSLGDEGFFNQPSSGSYPYQGGEGIDFVANLRIPNLDYGTIHLYTQSWGQTYDWGNQWIRDHATACKAAGKSCVLEEYGVPTKGATREQWYTSWRNTIVSSGIAGDMFWQYGMASLTAGRSHDDGYTIYTDDSNYQQLVVQWAAQRK